MKDEIPQDACFECGAPADYDHHVIPRSQGGRRTVALCRRCQIAALMPTDDSVAIPVRPAKSLGAWSTKLTAEQVLEIRAAFANGARQVDLSKQYRVSKVAIHKIVNRKSWQQLPEPDLNEDREEDTKDESAIPIESD